MLFMTPWLLLGVASIAVPIIIHLLNRRSAKYIQWGAVQFLFDSFVSRKRRILLEEVLLLGTRCLLLALVATAMARPFVPAGSKVPWLIVLPMSLVAVVAFGISFALWQYPKWRLYLMMSGAGFLLLAAVLVGLEGWINLNRFGGRGNRDVALILDGSRSMALEVDGKKNFDRAVEEARRIIERSSRRTSFSLIVGGSVPEPVVPTPMTDRKELFAALDEIKATHGTLKALESISASAVSLSQGYNPGKQIVIISDGQRVGWDTGSPSRWSYIADAFRALPARPLVVLRRLSLPKEFRNAAVSDIALSRSVVGVDREVGINVNVVNTGTEAVTPAEVRLKIGDVELKDNTIGQLGPGASETIKFRHHFKTEGSYVLTATIVVSDELPDDDTAVSVVNVVGTMKVLIVDGNPSGRFLERAGAFAALALAPSAQTMTGTRGSNREFLVEPELIEAPNVVAIKDFNGYGAVLLADVPRLPADVAEALARFARAGGGVLVAPGERAQPDFYNNWRLDKVQQVLPAQLEKRLVQEGNDELRLSPGTFSHPALKLVADASQSDIGAALVSAHWLLKESRNEEAVSVGARFSNGDPFLVERRLGRGYVLLLATSLDNRSGNLASRYAFLPMMHEIACFLANPGGIRLNVEPARRVSLALSGDLGKPMAGGGDRARGLRGTYYLGDSFKTRVLSRIDPGVDFDWNTQAPAPNVPREGFSVRWTGTVRPPQTGDYTFYTKTDDGVRLWVNGQQLCDAWKGQAATEYSGSIKLEGGKEYALRMEYYQGGGGASAALSWSGPGFSGKQIIPASALSADMTDDFGSSAQVEAEVTSPTGAKLKGFVTVAGEGSVASVEGGIAPGLYRLKVPEAVKSTLAGVMAADGTVPFTVRPDVEESSIEGLNAAEMEFIKKHTELLEANSVDDVMQALAGKAFGEELWRPLAVAALLLLLAEVALTRWIARERRVGDEKKVAFEELGKPSVAFREQLERMQSGAGRPDAAPAAASAPAKPKQA